MNTMVGYLDISVDRSISIGLLMVQSMYQCLAQRYGWLLVGKKCDNSNL
jgi:hypothetical protein